MITKSEAPSPEQIEVHKHQRYIYSSTAETGETCLTLVTKASVAP